MAEQHRPHGEPPEAPETADETFKREGPVPAGGSTGETVEDMNQAARDALLRNIRPGKEKPDA